MTSPAVSPTPSRRRWLQHSASLGLAWASLQAHTAWAQKMESGQLQTLAQMIEPITQGAKVVQQDVTITAPILADNGSLVPLGVQVQSPMTAQDHVTHLYLLSQRNPVTRMAVFHMGPWNGRAEINTRVRLAGTQAVVALARLSSGEFRYGMMDIIVTESACVDAS
jgi:sulfur-oxidizing protein SoxY